MTEDKKAPVVEKDAALPVTKNSSPHGKETVFVQSANPGSRITPAAVSFDEQRAWRHVLNVLRQGAVQGDSTLLARAKAMHFDLTAQAAAAFKHRTRGADEVGNRLLDRAEQLDKIIDRFSLRTLDAGNLGPTPETVVKYDPGRYDPILKLVEAGDLEPAHARAASMIARVYEGVTRVVIARSREFGAPPGGGGQFEPLRMSESLYEVWRLVYLPWCRKMRVRWFWVCLKCGHHYLIPPGRTRGLPADRRPCSGRKCGGPTVRRLKASLRLVMDVAVGGQAVSTARQKHGRGRSRAVILIRCGLELFDSIREQAGV